MTEFSPQVNFKNDSLLKEENSLDVHSPIRPIHLNAIDRKCGEIFVLANTEFWFLCTFCDERFHSIVVFQNHIKIFHITNTKSIQNTADENPLDFNSNEKFKIKIVADEKSVDHNENTEGKICKWEMQDDIKAQELYNKDHNIGDIGIIQSSHHEEQEGLINETNNNKIIEVSQNNISSNENVSRAIHRKKNIIHDSPKKRIRRKKVYSCSYCEHIATNQSTLEAHKQSCHDAGTRYQCEECGKCFSNASNLRHHLVIHSGTRPYKCEFCDAGFSHSNSLKAHRYLHTGNRPYKCVECDKGFVSSGALKIHMREHTGETPYVCQFCKKAFATQCSYKRHMISHAGQRTHKCQQCEKAFLHKETLNTHMACHSTEKLYACDICPKKFNHKKNLAQHKKLHSSIKQYVCKICGKDFAQYAGLHSHMKSHRSKSVNDSNKMF
ncbi:zinc finger protein 501-like [Eupeodes corollae]|uniref:zinc finger protein 501-like n=1 Tax=Eupeodes corollae TaxID=290404 RepID=UPI0024925153|nr:zinc finger protein 501-like [Eupeodes corollae]